MILEDDADDQVMSDEEARILLRESIMPAEEALDRLRDALREHDLADPDFGPPEFWPSWTDENAFVSNEDYGKYLDALERSRYERGCNLRFT